jgi:hypothetical protein
LSLAPHSGEDGGGCSVGYGEGVHAVGCRTTVKRSKGVLAAVLNGVEDTGSILDQIEGCTDTILYNPIISHYQKRKEENMFIGNSQDDIVRT